MRQQGGCQTTNESGQRPMSDSGTERELSPDSPIASGDSGDPTLADTGTDRPVGESLDEGSSLPAEPSEPEVESDAAQAPEGEASAAQPSSLDTFWEKASEYAYFPSVIHILDESDPDTFWEKASEYDRLRSAIKRIAARRRNADLAERSVRYYAQKDPEANAETRLPPSEQILVPVIWLAEVFTPTTIDNLVTGIRELRNFLVSITNEFDEWVLSSRRQGRYAYNPLMYVSVDQMPAGIDNIYPVIQTLTSTVTVLTVAFRLKDDQAHELTQILNQDFATRARVNPYGRVEILDVAWQKSEAVNEWRSALRRDAANWIADRFPGFFCKIAPERMPAIDLLLTKSYIPWDFRAESEIPKWAKIVDLISGYGYLQCKENDALRLNQGTRANQQHSLTLAATESGLLTLEGVTPGDRYLREAINALDSKIPFLLSRWSLSALLAELEEQIPSIQDAADRVSRDSSPRALAQVQHQLLRSGLDSRIVANDIVRYTADPMWKWGVPDFSEVLPPSSSPERTPIASLTDSLRQGQAANGQRVAQLEADLREVLSTNAEIAAAGANLRFARRLVWLTIVAVIVAIVAAVAAVVAISRPSTPSTTTPVAHQSSSAAHPRASASR
jgi:hypothetical protein